YHDPNDPAELPDAVPGTMLTPIEAPDNPCEISDIDDEPVVDPLANPNYIISPLRAHRAYGLFAALMSGEENRPQRVDSSLIALGNPYAEAERAIFWISEGDIATGESVYNTLLATGISELSLT